MFFYNQKVNFKIMNTRDTLNRLQSNILLKCYILIGKIKKRYNFSHPPNKSYLAQKNYFSCVLEYLVLDTQKCIIPAH